MTKKKHIKKSFAQRIFELSQSLKIIHDCLSLLETGRNHQVIPLSGQLRALITDKTTKPLLFVIGEELKEDLNFYVMEKPEIPTDGLIFAKSNFRFALEKELPGQKLVNINEFLDAKVIKLGDSSCSMRDIIGWYAHKAGGAHYSPDVPEDLAELLASGIGEAALIDALFGFGDVIYKLGHRLFKKVVNADIHMLLQIPQEVETEAFVIDFADLQSLMRLSFKVYPKIKMAFEVRGLSGQAILVIEKMIDWIRPRHLTLSIVLEDNLDTSLLLYVDGNCMAKSTFPELVIIANEPSIYDMYVNRSAEAPDTGLVMACAHLAIYNSSRSALDKARTLVWYAGVLENEEIPCTYFDKGGYAYKQRGQVDFPSFGKCIEWDMKKLSIGEKPW